MAITTIRRSQWYRIIAASFAITTLHAQMAGSYSQAAAAYRAAAAQTSGPQAQCYLNYARYHDCLANMMTGGGQCGSQPSCSIAPSSSASTSQGLGAAFPGASGGSARQQAINQGFNLLRSIIQNNSSRQLQQQFQQQQNDAAALQQAIAQAQALQQLDQMLAMQREQLLEAAADQLLSGAQTLTSSADQLLADADALLNSAPITPGPRSPQGNALSQANGDQCPNGWDDQSYTVTPWGSDAMWLQTDGLAFITNQNGQADPNGGYLSVQYGTAHKSHLYFGLSGVLNNDLAPGGRKLIPLSIYRGKNDPPISLDIRVRYCRP